MSHANVNVPRPSLHRASGQAVVRINGKDHYLGAFGSPSTDAAYDRLIMDWLARGRQLPRAETGLLIVELIVAYVKHAEGYYVKGGRPTSEYRLIWQALRWLKKPYGRLPVEQFGPRSLEAVRQKMIASGLSRKTINEHVRPTCSSPAKRGPPETCNGVPIASRR